MRSSLAWLVVAGCVTAEVSHREATLLGELEVRHGCAVPPRISAVGDDGAAALFRVDACGAPTFYRCWYRGRSPHLCCATTTPPGKVDMFRYETRDYTCDE